MKFPKLYKSKKNKKKKYGSGKNTDKLIEQEFNLIEEIRKIQEKPSNHIANTIIHLLKTPDLHKKRPTPTTLKALKRLMEEADKINQTSAIKDHNEKEFKAAVQNALYDLGPKKFTKKASSNIHRPKPKRSSKK